MSDDLWTGVMGRQGFEDLGEIPAERCPESLNGRAFLILIGAVSYTLEVVLPLEFPNKLPRIFLRDFDHLLPHVSEDGLVCYSGTEGILIETNDPAGIVEQAVGEALEIIQDGLSGRNASDFADEFDSYWGRAHPGCLQAVSQVTVGDATKLIWARFEKRWKLRSFLDAPPRAARPHLGCNALYVPLDPSHPLVPPPFGSTWTPDKLREVVHTNATLENRALADELVAELKMQPRHAIVFGLARPSGGRLLFGSLFTPVGRGRHFYHPFRGGEGTPTPIQIHRTDPEFLVERGGGAPELLAETVLVVGCGAVGSVVAELLAKAGVGRLVLVDPDTLAIENVHRHTHGAASCGRPKVLAIAESLRLRFPFLSVSEHQQRIEDLVKTSPWTLSEPELVIFATGDPTLELRMNRLVWEGRKASIHVWLEPLSIGGHALLTNASYGETGCFECLFRSEAGFTNAAAFAEPGQKFSKQMSGCATAFVPFGGIDATRTACLAAQLAVDYLTGTTDDHPLVSWKGDARDFTSAGFRTSARYRYTQDELDSLRFAYKSPMCPTCSRRA